MNEYTILLPDIINNIWEHLAVKDHINCLLTAKMFNVHNHTLHFINHIVKGIDYCIKHKIKSECNWFIQKMSSSCVNYFFVRIIGKKQISECMCIKNKSNKSHKCLELEKLKVDLFKFKSENITLLRYKEHYMTSIQSGWISCSTINNYSLYADNEIKCDFPCVNFTILINLLKIICQHLPQENIAPTIKFSTLCMTKDKNKNRTFYNFQNRISSSLLIRFELILQSTQGVFTISQCEVKSYNYENYKNYKYLYFK
jgi:hypothetical protein